LNPPPDRVCTKECQIGVCDCTEGHRRNSEGDCVPESECDESCPGENEAKSGCYNNCSARTCANLNPPPGRVCTLECRLGVCDCVEGYRRNSEGVCVPENECEESSPSPDCDGENEEVSACYNPCFARTCAPPDPDRVCTAECRIGVCDCKDGYRRNSERVCVPENECEESSSPVPRGCCTRENEAVSPCYNPCTAQTCENLNPPPDRICTRECQIGVCDCVDGYRRGSDGVCAPESECEESSSGPDTNLECGEHEAVSKCYNPCSAQTCENLDPPPDRICTLECQIGVCDCVEGYRRNNSRSPCEPERNCPKPVTCNPRNNEEKRCFNSCSERTCEHVNSPIKLNCITNCTVGCDCKIGYARNPAGQCVLSENCPCRASNNQ